MKIVNVWVNEDDELNWFNKMDEFFEKNSKVMKYGQEIYNIAINQIYLDLHNILFDWHDENGDLIDYIFDNSEKIIDFNYPISIEYLKGIIEDYESDKIESTTLNGLHKLIVNNFDYDEIINSSGYEKVKEIRSEIIQSLSATVGEYGQIYCFFMQPDFNLDPDDYNTYYSMFKNREQFAYVDIMTWIQDDLIR